MRKDFVAAKCPDTGGIKDAHLLIFQRELATLLTQGIATFSDAKGMTSFPASKPFLVWWTSLILTATLVLAKRSREAAGSLSKTLHGLSVETLTEAHQLVLDGHMCGKVVIVY